MGVKSRLILALAASLLTTPALAARGFGPTNGSATTDKIQTSDTTALGTQTSWSAWVYIAGIGASGDTGGGRIFGIGLGALYPMATFNSAGNLIEIAMPFSTTIGQWKCTSPAFNAWHHVAVTYDGSATSNVPVCYVDGVSQTVTQIAAPVGTYNPTAVNIYIGNRSGGDRNFHGNLADVAYWSGAILTQNEMSALAARRSPLQIRPASLVLYLPLYGVGSDEPDWGPSHFTQTITGTVYQHHPGITPYPLMNSGQ